MSFLEELQRRKVLRTVIAYLVAAFGVAQGVQLLVDAFAWPHTVFTGTVILAIALLPVVVIVSWLYDRGSIPWRKVLPPALAVATVAVIATTVLTMRGNSKPLDKNLVAILPFRVTSATADLAFLHEGVVDLLATKLTGEGGPRAIDPQTVLAAIKQNKLSEVDYARGGPVAERVGVGNIIMGSIVGTAQRMTITANLTDVTSNKTVPAQVEGALESLPLLIDSLAAKLLTMRTGQESQELASLTSASLPALRSYIDARAAYREAHFMKAADLFRRALEIDSTFALAAMGHILSSNWEGEPTEFEETAKRLLVQGMDRLGPIDRLVANAVQGSKYPDTRSVKEKLQAWESVLDKAPDRADAWFLYGDKLVHDGKLAEIFDNDSIGLRAFDRALQIDSSLTPALLHKVDFAIISGNRQEAERFNRIRALRDPTGSAARYQFLLRSRFFGDSAALQAWRSARDTLPFNELYVASFLPFLDGQGVDDALSTMEIWLKRATTRAERLTALEVTHKAYLTLGAPSKAAASLRERALLGDEVMAYFRGVTDALYADGDPAFANEAAAKLEELRGSAPDRKARSAAACALAQRKIINGQGVDMSVERRVIMAGAESTGDSINSRLCLLLVDALNADLNKANQMQKVDALDAFLRSGPAADELMLSIGNMATSRLYERNGDRASALRAIQRRAFSPGTLDLGVAALREEARLRAATGDRAGAIKRYRKYLDLHLRAEPSLKQQDDAARRDLARLTGEN